MRFIPARKAAITLETTVNVIWVTACNWKKKHGEYPQWYKSEYNESFVDIDYVIELRDRERNMRNEAVDLYFFITEDMGMRPIRLTERLAQSSEIYSGNRSSWNSFIYKGLFTEPVMKFYYRQTRLEEFHRIATQIKDEYDTNRR